MTIITTRAMNRFEDRGMRELRVVQPSLVSLVCLSSLVACSPPLSQVRPASSPALTDARIATIDVVASSIVVDAASDDAASRATAKAKDLVAAKAKQMVARHGYRLATDPPGDAMLVIDGVGRFNTHLPYRDLVARRVFAGIGVAVAIVGVTVALAASNGRSGIPWWLWNYPRAPDLPLDSPTGNALALTASLVDRTTGEVLWVATLGGAVDPVDRYEVGKQVSRLLAKLPRAGR